jgi:N-ethylmaleimide reductase
VVATDLFDAYRLGSQSLANRIVMSPMTRNRSPRGVPTTLNAEYYAQRASAGLIVAEATAVSEEGIGYLDTPGIFNAEQIAGWRVVTDEVHRCGGRIFSQLWHCGRNAHPGVLRPGELPIAPSPIPAEGTISIPTGRTPFSVPRALASAEIPVLVARYRRAAVNAREAGFDGVEIHAGNGYLLDQFLRQSSNQRSDRYGGSVENRCRLLWEIAEAVVDVWGSARVGVRISPMHLKYGIYDPDPERLYTLAIDGLNRIGIAYLNVREGSGPGQPPSPAVDFIGLRARFAGSYVANDGYDLERGLHARRSETADLISFARPFIANPDLVERLKLEAPWNPLDLKTLYGGDHRGYTDYPTWNESLVS